MMPIKVQVYVADVSTLNDASAFERALSLVPEYRQEKALRFKFLKGQVQSLGVGLLLKKACADFGIAGADAHIAYGENEKPLFAEFPDVHFNLSHSAERVMCCISTSEVGCDVEQIKGDRGRLAERFFKPSETAWIQHFATEELRSRAFYRLWTLKECYMKVTGLGLSLPPDAFTLHVDDAENISLEHEGFRPEYVFREFDLHDEFRYACCVKSGCGAQFDLQIVDLKTLYLQNYILL